MPSFRSWRSYRVFESAVRSNLRYIHSQETAEFLEMLCSTANSRIVALNADYNFWRAQLDHDYETEVQGDESFEVECPSGLDRMKPLPDRAFEGRANPKGIPCLYLATTKETAMAEVRPWIGSLISVGQFKVLRTLRIIDCSHDHTYPLYLSEPSAEEKEKAVWSDINRAFSEPVTRSDDTASYAPTQIIAELFKHAGFGGIAYKSNFGEDSYNTALFDIGDADLINCFLYRVENVDMKFKEHGHPYFMRQYYDDKGR